MIDTDDKLFNINQQCELLDVPRSSFYYEPIPLTAAELELMERFERFHFGIIAYYQFANKTSFWTIYCFTDAMQEYKSRRDEMSVTTVITDISSLLD
ncbi:MAG: hypothetical protein LBU65_12580 [Planctomycetaceae bacterium]|nr:hypothetical protein [Planctomycetaceae bacterium]